MMSYQAQDLTEIKIYDSEGRSSNVNSVFEGGESFVIIQQTFCIGCAEYLVKCSKSKKVLVVIDGFSLISISTFQTIPNATLFFVSKAELDNEFGTVAMAIVKGDTLCFINEKGIHELSKEYQETVKAMKGYLKSYFRNKCL